MTKKYNIRDYIEELCSENMFDIIYPKNGRVNWAKVLINSHKRQRELINVLMEQEHKITLRLRFLPKFLSRYLRGL